MEITMALRGPIFKNSWPPRGRSISARTISSPGCSARLLHPHHELVQAHSALPVGAGQHDLGVEGGQHRQGVARRRGGAQVAPQGPGVANGRGAHRAGGLGQGGGRIGQSRGHHLGVGDPAAYHHPVVGNAPLAQFGHLGHGHHLAGTAQTPVDLHHEIGASGQHGGVGVVGQRTQGLVQAPGHYHIAHLGAPEAAQKQRRLRIRLKLTADKIYSLKAVLVGRVGDSAKRIGEIFGRICLLWLLRSALMVRA